MNQWKSGVDTQLAALTSANTALQSAQATISRAIDRMEAHAGKTTSILDKIEGGWRLFKWIVWLLLSLIALEIGLSHAGPISRTVKEGWMHMMVISAQRQQATPLYARTTHDRHQGAVPASFEYSITPR